jgi:hypothetical protein
VIEAEQWRTLFEETTEKDLAAAKNAATLKTIGKDNYKIVSCQTI